MMRKKIVSLCMALVLCLGLLPVTAEAAAEGAPSSLYVGNYQITNSDTPTYLKAGSTQGSLEEGSETDWTVKYDPSTATLTLSGATIKGGSDVVSIPYGSGIYAQGSSNQPVTLTIELIGENTITGTFGIYVNAEINASSYGTNATLTIMGENSGSLEVSGSNNGIYVKSGTGNASLNIKNVAVTSSTNDNYAAGVYVMSSMHATSSPQLSLKVNGGSLTASGTGSSDGIWFYVGSSQATGATTRLTVSENAIVDARNGGIKASDSSMFDLSDQIVVSSGDGTNGGIVFDGSAGTVYGNVTLDKSLTINEGETLTVPDGSSLNCNGNLTNNGTILASGGTVTGKLKGSANDIQTPSITAQPTGQTVTEGSAAMFSVTASAGDSETLTYQWQQSTDNGGSWANIESATSAKYTTEATTTSMSGNQYRCVVTGSGVSVISAPATLTVNAAATTITTQPSNVTVTEGETATFSVTATGSNLTYQWQQSTDGSAWANISGATSSSYTTQAATMDMDGWQYRCVVTDGNSNGVTSQAATLTVTAATVSVTGVSLDKTELSLTVGGTETLTATVAPDNATDKTVTWTSSNPSVATVENGVVTAVAPGTAVITATTQDGNHTATCAVTVRPDIPPANPNYRITVEATQGGTVTADPTAAKAGATVTLTPVPDRGYQVGSVAVTDRFGDAVAVTEQADGTYTFTMPNGQVTVTVTFAETPLPFTDVTEGDWFYDAVRYAYETGLMDGVGDSLFAPNSETTRAQLVTILYRLEGEPEVSGTSGFTDVEADIWYTDAVAWAAQNGIVNGVSDTEFAPGDDITREQLAAILYRYAACQGYDVSQRADLSGFGDASSISGYAQEALSWAHAQGLVLGFEDGSLRPQGTASRAQIAAVLMRFLAAVSAA